MAVGLSGSVWMEGSSMLTMDSSSMSTNPEETALQERPCDVVPDGSKGAFGLAMFTPMKWPGLCSGPSSWPDLDLDANDVRVASSAFPGG